MAIGVGCGGCPCSTVAGVVGLIVDFAFTVREAAITVAADCLKYVDRSGVLIPRKGLPVLAEWMSIARACGTAGGSNRPV